MPKRQSVLYFPNSTLLSRVKGHKGSPVLPRLLPSIVMGSLLRRAHFESLRAAEAKNSATINQLKYRSRSCITANIALGAWSRANKALGCASCFIGSRPHPRAIFAVMHSHGTLTSIKIYNISFLEPMVNKRLRHYILMHIRHILIYSVNVHAFAEVNVGFASLHYTIEEGPSGASLLEVCLQVFGSNTLSQASLVRVQTLPRSAQG